MYRTEQIDGDWFVIDNETETGGGPFTKDEAERRCAEANCDGTHSHAPGACSACDQAFDELEGD